MDGTGGSPRRRLRQRAFEALELEIATNGYARTSVAGVLQRAGMSRRTFYTHFTSREDCFLAAYDAMRDAALARLAAGTGDQPETWRGHVADALGAMLALLAERPHGARLLLVEPPSIGPTGIERHEETMRAVATLLARSHPRLPDTPTLAVEAGVGAVHRVIQARLVSGRANELPTLTEALTAVVEQLAEAAVTPG